jgi:cytochrome c biogenesis protein
LTTDNRGVAQTVWDFFCSLKLSIFLLIGLATTSIIGTIIPQGPPPPEYLQTISQAKFKIYYNLGFFDMYHSVWFLALLGLLTINLITCSIKRLPRVWKIISEPTLVMDDGFAKSLSLTHDVKLTGEPSAIKDRVAAFLRKEFAEPKVTEVDGEYHLFAEKNPYCRLGVYVVHLSIIIIFIGAIIGTFAGYKGYAQIPEGASISTIESRSGKLVDLGFAVKCEKFSVSFYDTGAPREFKSILTVLENGRPVPGYENVKVIVNEPLTYKGITFYQSSYGQSGEGAVFHVSVRERKGGAPVSLTLRQGERISLPGGGTMQVLEATQDVKPFLPQFSGPAAKVEVTPAGGSPEQFVVLNKDYDEFNAQHSGNLIFTFDGADEKYYTGLQVAKDPGVWVVWFGCALMVIGILLAFFFSHKRIWVRVARGRVTLGGTASKNQGGFQLVFDDLAEKLKSA